MRTLLLLAVLTPAIVLAIRSQFIALLVYVWFTLAAPLEWVWTDLTALRLSLLLGLLVAIPRERLFGQVLTSGVPSVGLRSYGVPDTTHPLSIGMILFLLTAFVAQVGAASPAVGWKWIDYLLKLFLVALTAVSLISSEQRLRWLTFVIGGSVALNSAKLGIAYFMSGGTVRHDDGLQGAFSDNNGFALLVAMALPMMAAAAQNTTSRLFRWGWWGAAAASTLALVSTFSRGGFLSLVAAGLVFLLLQRKRLVVLLVVGCTAAVALLVVPIPKAYVDRLSTIRTYEQVGETSAMSRLHLWEVAVDIAKEHPLGVGLFNYEVVYDRFDRTFGLYGKGRSVHSSHFQVLADQGYGGAVVWALLFVVAFALAFRARARADDPDRSAESQHILFTTSNALIASMVGFLVGGSFLAAALNEFTWLTFAMIAGLDIVSARPVGSGADVATSAGGGTVIGSASSVPRFRGAYRRTGSDQAVRPGGRA